MSAQHRVRRSAIVAGVVAMAITLAGCVGDTDPAGTADGPISVSTPAGGDGAYVGARSDVQLLSCQGTASGGAASGEVTNPEDERQDYRIYVSAVVDGATVAVTQVDVTGVDPDVTAAWETELGTTDDEISCILRVERTASAS